MYCYRYSPSLVRPACPRSAVILHRVHVGRISFRYPKPVPAVDSSQSNVSIVVFLNVLRAKTYIVYTRSITVPIKSRKSILTSDLI